MFICQYCNRESNRKCGNSFHERYCKLNPNRQSYLTSGTFKMGCTGTASTIEKEAERKRKLSVIAVESGLGGRVIGSGRGKKGWYKGFFCDSSWELAYLIYQLDHDVKIERCKEVRFYNWKNKKRKYYPDFVVDGKLIEVKGYKTEQWEAKHSANPDVAVLYEKEMEPYLRYVKIKYGKDFIKLYGG